jgi:hypothetical protein
VAEFIETVERITAGASVVDPSLVRELVRVPLTRAAAEFPASRNAAAAYRWHPE